MARVVDEVIGSTGQRLQHRLPCRPIAHQYARRRCPGDRFNEMGQLLNLLTGLREITGGIADEQGSPTLAPAHHLPARGLLVDWHLPGHNVFQSQVIFIVMGQFPG